MPGWKRMGALGALVLIGVSPIACGGDGGSSPGATGGTGADDNGSGGNGTSSGGSGNGNGTGSGGDDNGSGGDDNGSGGSTSSSATAEELIEALCEWEFGCCDEGELTYRLGTAGTSVESCVDFFTFQLRESNVTNNPFPSGSATGLLGALGYTINPNRVTENAANMGACIAELEATSCSVLSEELGYCGGTVMPGDSACSLTKLFDPALEVGDRCTLALAEGAENDVECPQGSTCLPAAHEANPEEFPTCVQRGTDGNPCTSNDACDYNFYCHSDGVCRAKGDEGDGCTFTSASNPLPGEERDACKAGLKCSPLTLTCVANCDAEYPCEVNVECPEGQACVPVTVGDDAVNWKLCRALGTSATARCDEDADCVASRYCGDNGRCQADESIGNDCARDEMCEDGSFCDLATTGSGSSARTPTEQCTGYFQPTEPCFPFGVSVGYSSGCDPAGAPACLFNYDADTSTAEWRCASARRGAGGDCFPAEEIGLVAEPSDCQVGMRCENVDSALAWPYKCTPGAALGEDCDDLWGDDEALRCAVGLACKDGTCVAQLDAGGDCEDLDTDGVADPELCKNFDCVENWDQSGTDFICSDAPVPVTNGGDGLICSG